MGVDSGKLRRDDDAPAITAVLPPAESYQGRERRATKRAFDYWRMIAQGRRYPSLDDVDLTIVGDLDDHLFFLTVKRPVAECDVLESCPSLKRALGFAPDGRRIADILPREIERPWFDALDYTIGIGNPMEVQGRWTCEDDDVILYRAVFLPLSDDARAVTHILGAFNFKCVPAIEAVTTR
jgi:hypothetical protein